MMYSSLKAAHFDVFQNDNFQITTLFKIVSAKA